MAVNHTTLWTKLGKLCKSLNTIQSIATVTLPAQLVEIQTAYGTSATTTGSTHDPLEGLGYAYDAFQGSVVGWRQAITTWANRTVTDWDTIVKELNGLTTDGLGAVWTRLLEDMVEQGITVNRSTVTLGSVTAATRNRGNGTILLTKVLDGYNAPIGRSLSSITYDGVDSELCVPSETAEFLCVSDNAIDHVGEGNEVFSWGSGVVFGSLDYHQESSGQGPGLIVANGNQNLLANGTFESPGSDSLPSSWSRLAGTAGTNIYQDTTTGYRGSTSLVLVGDGSLSSVGVYQEVQPRRVNGRRRYCVTARIRRGGPIPSAGRVNLYLVGTNYLSVDQIDVALTSLTTEYALYSFFTNLPPVVPSTLWFVCSITDTPTADTTVQIDDVTLTPVTYWGGYGAVAVCGKKPFVRGDRFTASIANSEAVLQKFARQVWGIQMPSVVSGDAAAYFPLNPMSLFTTTSSPTLADSLGT